MIVTIIFSFSNDVFKRLLFQGCENQGLLWKGIIKGFDLCLASVHFPGASKSFFVAFVDDNATIRSMVALSIPYFENHVRYFVQY